MVVDTDNPVSKIIYTSRTFHPIAISATWNTVVRKISNLIVHSVNAVVNVLSVMSLGFVDLARFCAAIMAGLLGNPSKEIPIKPPFNVPVPSVVFGVPVERTKRRLSLRKPAVRHWFTATTAFGFFASKSSALNGLFLTANTQTQPLGVVVPIAPVPSNYSPVSKFHPSQVNKVCHIFPSFLLRCTTSLRVLSMFARDLSR